MSRYHPRAKAKAVSVELTAPTVSRVKLFNPEAGRRVYADEVQKSPQYRAHTAVAQQLSVAYPVEFMSICRDVLPPAQALHHDKGRLLPPSFRSMKELIYNKRLLKSLSQALDVFAKKHPDFYRFTLESLYGTRTVVTVP